MHNYIVNKDSRFIQQFKEPYSASRSPVVITGAYNPEKLCKNKKKTKFKKANSYNFKRKFKFRIFWLIFLTE